MEKIGESELDFSSLNKYFVDDDKIQKPEVVKVNMIVEDITIAESSFRNYSYTEGDSEKKVSGAQKSYDKTEKNSESNNKKISPAKKEFLNDLEESDSLSLDTCSNVGRDWSR
jgi:hypothetical protein